MPKRLNVLFLPHAAGIFTPWGDDVIAALHEHHTLHIFDRSRPLVPQFKGIDVVIDHGGSVGTREMADAAHSVQLWQILGQGIDHFDLDYWRSRNIPVANCPGQSSAAALAECAMMFILMLSRQYLAAHANLKQGNLYEPVGIELEGLKLAVIGFGASGRELARRAQPFGMRITAVDVRDISGDEIEQFGLAGTDKPDDLDRCIATADVISLHLHLTPETRHIIDARRLALMQPSALIVNVARGALIDEVALGEALRSGKLGGAGLDVFSQEPPDMTAPLFQMPNVVTTAHIAGVTDATSRRRAHVAAENVQRIAAGLEPLYRVA